MTTADLYARKSTKDAGRSAARQELQWRADCLAEGLQHGEVFADPDLSASRHARKSRPDYANLLEHIRSGHCQMISMWEASRGSRDLEEWVPFLGLCREHGVLIRIFEEGGRTYDPRRQRDREELVRLGMAAEGEVERLRNRVTTGTRDAASQGRPAGPTLYGYSKIYGAPREDSVSPGGSRRRDIEMVVVPEERAVIRRLVEDTLDGAPLQTQARRLNAEGVPTASGKGKWIGGGIRRLLLNPGLVGDRAYLDEIVARDAWPAIVTREDFSALRALLTEPGRRGYSGDAPLRYELSGAGRCDPCGEVLRMSVRPDRPTRYRCNTPGCMKSTASQRLMDETVQKIIFARLRRGDAARVFAPQVDDAAADAVRAELKEWQTHVNEHHDLAARRKLSAAALAAVEAGAQPEIARLERRLRELETPPALRKLAGVDIPAAWPGMPVGLRREVILALAEVRLSPVGKGGRWSAARLGRSRWLGDGKTWGERGLAG